MKCYYAYEGIGYELDKDAAWNYIRDGYLLAPRTVLKGRIKLSQSTLPSVSLDLNQITLNVQQTLEAALGNIAGMRRAVMFSGGFDSMLIACLAQHCGAQVTAVTVQFDDFNPSTVAGSIEFAKKVGIAHHILHVKAVEFLSAFEALAGMTNEPVMDLDLGVVYAAFKKYNPQIAGDVFISGMGADQWLGNEPLKAKAEDLAARLDLAMVDENAHHQVAEAHGVKFVFPFLSESMLVLSQVVPAVMKKDKKLLRELAIAKAIPYRGARSEVQVPLLMRDILIKTYGDRAWPCPVSLPSRGSGEYDQTLRQIMLGLWLEKAKNNTSLNV